jgi:hypothetical protein
MRIHLEMLMAYSLVLAGGLGHTPFGVTKEVRVLREWPLTCLGWPISSGSRLEGPGTSCGSLAAGR